MPSNVKKFLLIFTGSLSLGLGLIGIILPVLPTTPFLLLAAFCYLRSSAPLYHWLMRHPLLGPYLDNYINHRAIKRSLKISTIALLWLSLLVSMFLIASFHLRIFLAIVGLAVTIHVLSLRSLESLPRQTRNRE
jgi:hypothetical protein